MNLVEPLFLLANRVRRSYRGGFLLDGFQGCPKAKDGDCPEDWLFSTTPAQNAADPNEGLGRVFVENERNTVLLADLVRTHGGSLLGDEHTAVFGRDVGFRGKLIDPVEPTPVQYCPPPDDEATPYEAGVCGGVGWQVLGTRKIENIAAPRLFAGLRDGADPAEFLRAVRENDRPVWTKMMHSVTLQSGETYFAPAGVPYAIDAGVFALQLSLAGDEQAVGPLPAEVSLCDTEPDLWGASFDPTRLHVRGHVLHRSDEGYYAERIASDRTTAFTLWHVDVVSQMSLRVPRPFAFVLCIGGEGRMNWAGGTRELDMGNAFLQPYGVSWIEYVAYGQLNLLVLSPPSATD